MAGWSLIWQLSYSGLPLTPEVRREALALVRRGAQVGSEDAFALARCGHALTYLGREYDLGMSLVEQAVVLNPNLGTAWFCRGSVSVICCEFERAIESYDRMLRLSPLDQMRPHALQGRSFALCGIDQYDEGYADAFKAMQFVTSAQVLCALIVNAVPSGRLVEARQAAEKWLELQPTFRLSMVDDAFPARVPKYRDMLVSSLREAGLPD
jgi:adenylate cyclase